MQALLQVRWAATLCFIFPLMASLLAEESFDYNGCIYSEVAPCNPCTPLACWGNLPYTFTAQAKVLYLQPCSESLGYAAEVSPGSSLAPDWTVHNINPNAQLAFEVCLSAYCPRNNSEIAITWEHFNSSDSSKKRCAPHNTIGPFFEIGPDFTVFKKAKGKASFRLDDVVIDYGKMIPFSDVWQATFAVGVEITHFEQTIHTHFSGAPYHFLRHIKVPSTFLGAGPQVGVSTFYTLFPCLYPSFRLVGNFSAALLVGQSKNHTHFNALASRLSSLGIPSSTHQMMKVRESTTVVPEVKANLGVAASYTFCNGMTLDAEVGYLAQVYFNIVQSIDVGNEGTPPPGNPNAFGIFANSFRKTLGNFSLYGPYCQLTLTF